MKKVNKIWTPILLTIVTLFFIGEAFGAELSLKKFSVSPSPFRKGQTLRFTLEVENPNPTPASTRGLEIYAYVNDGTPEREGSGSFLGRTPLPPTIGPRATVTVSLAQTYLVPNNAGNQITFTILLPAITSGVEFGPAYSYRFNAVCTYNPELRLIPLGPMRPMHLGK